MTPDQISNVDTQKARAYMQAKGQAKALGGQVLSAKKEIAALQRKQTSLAKLGKQTNQTNFVAKSLAQKNKQLAILERQHGMAMKQERAKGTTQTRYTATQLEQQKSQVKKSGGFFGGVMSGLFGSGSSAPRPQSRPPSGGRPRF
ncbi:hypothetical protein ACFL1U_01480 [Patescibacteria group bacterium]